MKYKVPPVLGFAAAAFALEPEATTTPTVRMATAAEAMMRRLVFKPDICPPCRRNFSSRPRTELLKLH